MELERYYDFRSRLVDALGRQKAIRIQTVDAWVVGHFDSNKLMTSSIVHS